MVERIERISKFLNNKILEADIQKNEFDDVVKGKLGLVLYLLNEYKLKADEIFLIKITEILDDIFGKISLDNSFLAGNVTLADGLPGLGLVLHELVINEILDSSYKEQIALIADSCFEQAMRMLQQQNFDYFYGPTGILFFLNEVNSDEYCETIVEELHRYGTQNDFIFYNNSGDSYTRGMNFGFAHGTLALTAVLLKIYDKSLNQHKVKDLVINITERLLDFKKDRLCMEKVVLQIEGYDYPSWFPYNIISKNEDQKVKVELYESNLFHYTDRLGWCNSDLPHVLMLYRIGYTFNQTKYLQVAEEIGKEIVHRREFKDTAIKAANMCHGAAGVSLIYNRIYQMTGEDIYKKASEYWLTQTINYLETKMENEFLNHELELITGWLGPVLLLNDNYFGQKIRWNNFFLV